MNYKISLIALFLVVNALAYTDITMQNCPSQFDVSSANVTKGNTAANLGAFLYSGFQSSSTKTRVQNIVVKGDTKDLLKYTS